MRQAVCILTLLVLSGFTATCKPYYSSYRFVSASRSAVVIEYYGATGDPLHLMYAAFSVDLRSYLLTKAQSECDRYGKDAVLVRRERTRPSKLIISHYRCETRQADPIIDVK